MTNAVLPKDNRSSSRAVPVSDGSLRAFITRLHFYVGLFVGPFILIAAITGTLYVLTPQIEDWIYRDQLTTDSTGNPRSLSDQVKAARAAIGDQPKLFAVRPAIGPGSTTRVMFTEPGLGESESRAIFIDPATLAIKGDLLVYGTSGVLPLRANIDYLHRSLMLGDWGRYYSELAASWLWVAAIGGAMLWWWRRSAKLGRAKQENVYLRTRRLHGQIGIWIALGLIFISATGMTWSQLAGDRIDQFRNSVGWITPSVSTKLSNSAGTTASQGHHDHGAMHVEETSTSAINYVDQFDEINRVSKQAGIDSPMLEIRPPRNADQAWLVREYDRSWPSQVDTIAIDPNDLKVISRADFETFPIIAKLIRWGIDLHMGILFGVANQIVMVVLGVSLVFSILYGYRIWWLRRPPAGAPPRTLIQSWLRLSPVSKMLLVLLSIVVGWLLPMIGISLVAFLIVDGFRWTLVSKSQNVRPCNSGQS